MNRALPTFIDTITTCEWNLKQVNLKVSSDNRSSSDPLRTLKITCKSNICNSFCQIKILFSELILDIQDLKAFWFLWSGEFLLWLAMSTWVSAVELLVVSVAEGNGIINLLAVSVVSVPSESVGTSKLSEY